MKLENKETVTSSLSRIAQLVELEKPKRAMFEQSLREGAEEPITYDLYENAHDHTLLLAQLDNLIGRLGATEDGSLD